MARTRTYRDGVHPPDESGEVVELHLDNNAVAQVSQLPANYPPGFLIRVWPPNETNEYGGSNVTALSLSVEFVDGNPVLQHLDWRTR